MTLVCDTAIRDWCQRAEDLLNDHAARRRAMDEREEVEPPYTPTEEEIAAACREIQAGWTPEEEGRRRAKVVPWAVPQCRYRREMVE